MIFKCVNEALVLFISKPLLFFLTIAIFIQDTDLVHCPQIDDAWVMEGRDVFTCIYWFLNQAQIQILTANTLQSTTYATTANIRNELIHSPFFLFFN